MYWICASDLNMFWVYKIYNISLHSNVCLYLLQEARLYKLPLSHVVWQHDIWLISTSYHTDALQQSRHPATGETWGDRWEIYKCWKSKEWSWQWHTSERFPFTTAFLSSSRLALWCHFSAAKVSCKWSEKDNVTTSALTVSHEVKTAILSLSIAINC